MRQILHTICLLADLHGALTPSQSPNHWPSGEFATHPAPVAQGRGADQGNRQPDQTGIRRQLPGRGAVPRLGHHPDPVAELIGEASAPSRRADQPPAPAR